MASKYLNIFKFNNHQHSNILISFTWLTKHHIRTNPVHHRQIIHPNLQIFLSKCQKIQIFQGLLSSFAGEEAGDQWETISATLFLVNFYIFTCICICVCINVFVFLYVLVLVLVFVLLFVFVFVLYLSQVVRNTVRTFGQIPLTMFEKYSDRRIDPVFLWQRTTLQE